MWSARYAHGSSPAHANSAIARERTGVGVSGAVRWRTERSAVGTLVPSGGAPPGPVARRSRDSDGARLRGRRWKAEELGDSGFSGTQHRGDQRRQVEAALAGGAHDAGEDLLGVGAVAGAVAAAHLADDDGGPDGLFGAPVGGVKRGVPQEEEHGREFVGQVRREALGVFQRRRCVDQPTEAGVESAAGCGHPVLAQLSRVAAVAQVEAGPQDRLHLAGPGTVRIIFPELLAPLE